jgi:hypothetical protein
MGVGAVRDPAFYNWHITVTFYDLKDKKYKVVELDNHARSILGDSFVWNPPGSFKAKAGRTCISLWVSGHKRVTTTCHDIHA